MDKTRVDAHTRNPPSDWHTYRASVFTTFSFSVIHWPAGMDNREDVGFAAAVKCVAEKAVWILLRSRKVVSEVLPSFSELLDERKHAVMAFLCFVP